DDCQFIQPVYPGDTLTARSQVENAKASNSQPKFGIVTWHTEGFNQRGEAVIAFRRTNLVRRRAG
ncbi:MAG: MaoC family dehydratase, partial [Gammaproteobacteria bacterium]|nr:MaoC family dehydratase [Gammaproteobacteria bacterium]